MLINTSGSSSQELRLRSDLWHDLIHSTGQTFSSVEQLRDVLTKYAISRGFDYSFIKNELSRLTVRCKVSTCGWFLHATKIGLGPHFKIKSLSNVHTCGGGLSTQRHPKASKKWVSSIVMEKIADEPLYRPKDIKKDLFREYGVDVPYHQAWLGKDVAYKEQFGDERCSFDELRWYKDATQRSNPGSVVELDVTSEGRFRRFFICFQACMVGFHIGCRPLLFLDGTFLKDKYQGKLLAATALNGENELFPLAYAACDAENEENWEWFLVCLKKAVSTDRRITFVSDRCKGLLQAIPRVFPDSHNAFCLRHLEDNFAKYLRGKCSSSTKDALVELLKQAAYALTVVEFEKVMTEMRALCVQAELWARKENPNHWSNAFFEGERYGEMYSNPAESFNSMILGARNLPILPMVDRIRTQIMSLAYSRRNECLKWETRLCPKVDAIVKNLMDSSRGTLVNCSNGIIFEVLTRPSHVVNLQAGTCTCREWQVRRLPCKHVCAVVHKIGGNVEDYCSMYYTVECYANCYKETIQPMSTLDQPNTDFENIEIKPPATKRKAGRPKKNRIPSQQALEGEKMLYTCSRCKQKGHNRKSCSNPIVE